MTFEIFKNSRRGRLNKISDVKGVRVGHSTIKDGKIKTGVTCIMPHDGDVFNEKLVANSYIINGYGKSLGLVQLEELGTLESPIFMTNTMSLGRVLDSSMKWMIDKYPKLGDKSGAPNIIVTECNDGVINDMRGLHVKEKNVLESIENIKEDFEEGSVGAGTGMISFNLKSGIGSSSRIIEIDEKDYTLGSLVLSNFGRIKDLKIEGRPLGREMYLKFKGKREDKDKGSIIIVLATDLPLS
ncbi:MAG: P1 family peptidase, partial [Peptoniphilus harei]